MSFRMLVDDNYHNMDESQRYTQGEYATYEDALAASKRIVDTCLAEGFAPGMSAEKLYAYYTMFGEDPFIVDDPGSPYQARDFSAWDYAKSRCEELCARAVDDVRQDSRMRTGD